MSSINYDLGNLILDAKKFLRFRNYFRAAQIYEKIAKNIFKVNIKKSLEYFNLAVKYYLRSTIMFKQSKEFENLAQCYEKLGKLHEKWLNNPNAALDYFMTATKFRMMTIRSNIEYKNNIS